MWKEFGVLASMVVPKKKKRTYRDQRRVEEAGCSLRRKVLSSE
jgi:hypothetical protein